MTTLSDARREYFWKRVKWTLIILVLLALILFLNGPRFGAIKEALTPPDLPPLTRVDEQVWLDQNWSEQVREEFHHKSQGTATLPIPYSWFVALEKPSSSLLGILLSSDKRLTDNDYLLRFGFIKGKAGANNPDGLPIGFATTPMQSLPGLQHTTEVIGFNCAACHTGQIVQDGTQYVIEGGAAKTDLGQLTKALGAAMGQTAISSKLPLFNGRFKRFARNVLAERYSDATSELLSRQLVTVITALQKKLDVINVTEGFTRLDALNRIGNQVFSRAYPHADNYAPIDAPVNYPHIWTSSWFDWVQYDGSIMAPLVRNAGEALGVSAYLDTKSPAGEHRFGSSIPMHNLAWIEDSLAGDAFGPDEEYTGLTGPRWPEAFGAVDAALSEKGDSLYVKHCIDCHLPPLGSEGIWSEEYFGPIKWYDKEGNVQYTEESVLHVKVIPHKQIGTDMAQANVLINRTVDTSGRADLPAAEQVPGLGLDIHLCSHPPELPGAPVPYYKKPLVTVPFTDGGNVLFALALGAIVQQTIEAWFDQNYVSEENRKAFEGDRPNCLQAGAGYRARPLNGVWATAPFLHNGSVPTLHDLLSPVEDRPALVQLGSPRLDTKAVGVYQDPDLDMKSGKTYADNGLFILDTALPGNSNSGHEFSSAYKTGYDYDEQPQGVIGPELSAEERAALIEYLKTL